MGLLPYWTGTSCSSRGLDSFPVTAVCAAEEPFPNLETNCDGGWCTRLPTIGQSLHIESQTGGVLGYLTCLYFKMKIFFQGFIGSIVSGVCLYFLHYGACFEAIWLFDISITYDQRLLIEEVGYWVFVLGSVVGGVVIWKVFRVHTT